MSVSMKEIIAGKWDLRATEYTGRAGYSFKTDRQKQVWLETLTQVVGAGPQKVLDVGTGPGFMASLFAELGHDGYGLDFSREMLKIARDRSAAAGLNIQFQYGDAEELPFAAESFDVVVNRHLLWTLPRPGKALREWLRVLKPGGRLLIMDGNWGDHGLGCTSRLRRFAGNVIVSITERRNAWNWKGRYKDLESSLPFRGVDQEKVIALLEAAGVSQVWVPDISRLKQAEAEVLPLGYRLAYWDQARYLVVGKK